MDFIVEVATRMLSAGLWTTDGVDTHGWWDDHDELIGHVLFGQVLIGLAE